MFYIFSARPILLSSFGSHFALCFCLPYSQFRRTMANSLIYLIGFIVCCMIVGLSFLCYFILAWYVIRHRHGGDGAENVTPDGAENVTQGELRVHAAGNATQEGLSAVQLGKLPRITSGEFESENECAICLGEIETEQIATLIPGCNHVFHQGCVNTWLSKHPFCPICRKKLELDLFETPRSSS
nr:E3 ubiquitin-protein ligase ATL23-like [Nicotiana tomentosiformis]